MAVSENTFTSANLNGSYQYELTHNLNNSNLVPAWYDENGIQQATMGIFQVIDANNVVLNCNDTITGTHKLLLQYDAGTPAVTGSRLFEKSIVDPSDEMVLAFGGVGIPATNTEWSRIKELLAADAGYLAASNNLSDLTNAATGRSNLGVYSISQVNAYLNQKAALYQSGSGSVLGVSNTLAYNPSSNYHPATKKYVDDLLQSEILSYSTAGIIDAEVTLFSVDFYKYGNIVVVNGRVDVSISSSTAYLNICKLNDPANYPPFYRRAAAAPFNGANRNGGVIRIDDQGILSIATGSVDSIEYYAFNLVYII